MSLFEIILISFLGATVLITSTLGAYRFPTGQEMTRENLSDFVNVLEKVAWAVVGIAGARLCYDIIVFMNQ